MRVVPHAVLTALAVLLPVASCGGSSATTSEREVVVFAASSLTGAFTELGAEFEAANPGSNITFNFAGSGDLVQQIIDGAPADAFASADQSNMNRLIDAAHAATDPVTIARNTFEIIVEHNNPMQISGLADLANPDLVVVICAETVPCGRGAATVFSNASATVIPKSLEETVKGVVTKVTAGEADAGIVYVTDVLAAGDAAEGVSIPDDVNLINDYAMAVTKHGRGIITAQMFIDFVASPTGQAILAKYGFLAP